MLPVIRVTFWPESRDSLLSMGFKDHFSRHADDYTRYRPTYPAEFFDWLAQQAPTHALAWDCATGSGQSIMDHCWKAERTDLYSMRSRAMPEPWLLYEPRNLSGVSVFDARYERG
jgi:hypothetical protein